MCFDAGASLPHELIQVFLNSFYVKELIDMKIRVVLQEEFGIPGLNGKNLCIGSTSVTPYYVCNLSM